MLGAVRWEGQTAFKEDQQTEAHISQHKSMGSSNFHEFSGTRGTGKGGGEREGGEEEGGGGRGEREKGEERENLTTSVMAFLTTRLAPRIFLTAALVVPSCPLQTTTPGSAVSKRCVLGCVYEGKTSHL